MLNLNIWKPRKILVLPFVWASFDRLTTLEKSCNSKGVLPASFIKSKYMSLTSASLRLAHCCCVYGLHPVSVRQSHPEKDPMGPSGISFGVGRPAGSASLLSIFTEQLQRRSGAFFAWFRPTRRERERERERERARASVLLS